MIMLAGGPVGAPAQSAAATLPDEAHAADLVRATLLSLNEANLTANYSVLREASAPDFKRTFAEDALARIFLELRERNVDLGRTALREPRFDDAVYIADRGIVAYQGQLAAAGSKEPGLAVRFRLAYQLVGDRWRLFGVNLGLVQGGGAPERFTQRS